MGKKLICTIAPLALLLVVGWSHAVSTQKCTQESTCINVDKGNDAYTKEMAQQSKEQWDDTRSLRRKLNNRMEKEFDKVDQSIDLRERCETYSNTNAYWEPDTRRCLDRNTGRPLM